MKFNKEKLKKLAALLAAAWILLWLIPAAIDLLRTVVFLALIAVLAYWLYLTIEEKK